jgi:hypothetical protein
MITPKQLPGWPLDQIFFGAAIGVGGGTAACGSN